MQVQVVRGGVEDLGKSLKGQACVKSSQNQLFRTPLMDFSWSVPIGSEEFMSSSTAVLFLHIKYKKHLLHDIANATPEMPTDWKAAGLLFIPPCRTASSAISSP